jgi:chromate transporter
MATDPGLSKLQPSSVLDEDTVPYRLSELVAYALRLGTTGFGGPVALVSYMHRDLVEQRKWISESQYREGLALAQLAPGPLAAQVAIYLGFVHYRLRGATLVGLAFVLPSFLMVLVLGWTYVRYGGLPWMQAVFYGVGAAVIGIIASSAYKLTRKTLGSDRLLWGIFLVSAVATAITQSEIVWVVLGAGILTWLIKAPPRHWLRGGNYVVAAVPCDLPSTAGWASALDWHLLLQIALFFAEAGAFIFGSGLAIVPFLYGGVVKEHHWLNDRQFLDAVAVALITPGPVVITVAVIGYLVAGLPGAVVAALATFLPCYLFTVVPAPYFSKYGKLKGVKAFVDGVTAAAIGTITGAVIVLGQRSIVDFPTAAMALMSLAILWRFRRLPEPVLVAAAAVAGIVLFPFASR